MPMLTVFGRAEYDALAVPTELPRAAETVNRFLAEYCRLRQEHRDAAAEVVQLRNGAQQAERADTWALAGALRDGLKDPGRKNSEKLAAALQDAERRRDALVVALSGCEGDIRNAVQADTEWQARLDADLDHVRDRLVAIVDDLANAIGEREALRAARRFAGNSTDYRLAPGALRGNVDLAFARLLGELRSDASARPELEDEPSAALGPSPETVPAA